MEVVKVILLAVGLLGIAMVAMAISILVKKGGKFPNTHVSGNKHLKREGIYCVQTQDKLAQRKGWRKVKFEKLKLAQDMKVSK